MTPKKIGLIGVGQWGRRYIPAVDSSGLGKITHISRIKLALQDSLGSDAALVTVDQMLDAPIDGVILASHPKDYVRWASQFLAKGIAVMAEKPFAMDLDAMTDFFKSFDSSGPPFLVNHIHLFNEGYEFLRQAYMPTMGRKANVNTVGMGFGPFRDYSGLWDYGPHEVSMLAGLNCGFPTSFDFLQFAAGEKPGKITEIYIRFLSTDVFATLRFGNGAPKKSRTIEIIRENFWGVFDDTSKSLVINGEPVPLSMSPSDSPLARSVRAFLNSLHTGEQDWRFGIQVPMLVTRILSYADCRIRGD